MINLPKTHGLDTLQAVNLINKLASICTKDSLTSEKDKINILNAAKECVAAMS